MVWLTRDETVDGDLESFIVVWTARPHQERDAIGIYWACDAEDQPVATHRVEIARKVYATLPDTCHESIIYEKLLTPREV